MSLSTTVTCSHSSSRALRGLLRRSRAAAAAAANAGFRGLDGKRSLSHVTGLRKVQFGEGAAVIQELFCSPF